jgi:rare lipoprotein A
LLHFLSRASIETPMRRYFRLPLLLMVTGLAGCAKKTPPSAASQPPSVAAPQQAPAAQPFFSQTGFASFYGGAHDGKNTASGEQFDQHDFTAAHRKLAFGTVVRVTNLKNGRTVNVKITDRGLRIGGCIIDLSSAAARALDMQKNGITHARFEDFR